MNNKIRQDDINAVGELAGFVGMYMSDFVSKSDADARPKLFKRNPDPRYTMQKALKRPEQEDFVEQVVPGNSKIQEPKNIKTQQEEPAKQTTEIAVNQSNNTNTNQSQNNPQMEFNFVDNLIQGYGSVGDVIKHFNKRLDDIENSIRMLNYQLISIKSIIPQKKNKRGVTNNEPEKIT